MEFTHVDGLDAKDRDQSSVYDVTIYFLYDLKMEIQTIALKTLDSPVTGEKIRDFLVESFTKCGLLKNGKPETSIYGVSDEGSNIQKAMRLLEVENVIEGHIPCFNHKLQNAIKNATSNTSGMSDTLAKFRKNAVVLRRSRKERKGLRNLCRSLG